MTLNLGSLATITEREEEGHWLDIKHPSGDLFYMGNQTAKHLRIRVAGSYSERFRAAEKKLRQESIKKRGEFTADEVERRERSVLAACTLEWDAALDDDGKDIPLTSENAQALYKAGRFIFDQVNRGIEDHAGFFGDSSTEP